MIPRNFDPQIRDIMLRSRKLTEIQQEHKDISYLLMIIRQKDYEIDRILKDTLKHTQQVNSIIKGML